MMRQGEGEMQSRRLAQRAQRAAHQQRSKQSQGRRCDAFLAGWLDAMQQATIIISLQVDMMPELGGRIGVKSLPDVVIWSAAWHAYILT